MKSHMGIAEMVATSLDEDLGAGDITAMLLPENIDANATVIVREDCTICGIEWFNAVFQAVDPNVDINWQVSDGDFVTANQRIVSLFGKARSIVTGERCALNWLQTLSGTATITKQYLAAISSKAQLLDTRKTIPGLRAAQKYAVKIAGGKNHRMGLYDAFLIKENHIARCGSIAAAIERARVLYPDRLCEIEVESLEELKIALASKPDVVMLDNFSLADMREAVALVDGRVKLEVSGNVTLETISSIADTGVDYISVGAITKHLRAVDLSMRVQTEASQ